MIDFCEVEKYRENNRIEAKKALGGLPHSIWETYSAFANTLGGVILLGVEEGRDKTLHAIDLPDPEMLIEDFWAIIGDGKKVSENILTYRDVKVERVDGKRIVAITVPRADRRQRPVYIDGNPFTGSYHRSGEGDCRCSRDEVLAMLRDASIEEDRSVPLTAEDILRRMIFTHLTKERTTTVDEVAELLDIGVERAAALLSDMAERDIVETVSDGIYKMRD